MTATSIITGGPVPHGFVSGWAVHPLRGSMAHHWRVGQAAAGAVGIVSACGLHTIVTDQVPLLETGSFPLCGRCDEKLLRKVR